MTDEPAAAPASAPSMKERRPSLYGEGAADAMVPGENISILAGLGARTGAARSSRRSRLAATAVAGVAASLAYLMIGTVSQGGESPPPTVVVSAPDIAPAAAPGQAAEAGAPALIEADPTASILPAATVASLAPEASADTPAAQVKKSAARVKAPSAARRTVRNEPRKTRIAGAKPTGKQAQAASADADVDLIEALVARVSGERRPAERAAADAAARRELAAASPAPVRNAGAGKPGPSRDVVQRSPEATTEELVQRCRALGFLEGELCRWRICEGRWGKDAACSQAPADAGN